MTLKDPSAERWRIVLWTVFVLAAVFAASQIRYEMQASDCRRTCEWNGLTFVGSNRYGCYCNAPETGDGGTNPFVHRYLEDDRW